MIIFFVCVLCVKCDCPFECHPLTANFGADWWGCHLLSPNAAHMVGAVRIDNNLDYMTNCSTLDSKF